VCQGQDRRLDNTGQRCTHDVVKLVKVRRAAAHVSAVDPSDLPQSGGFWSTVKIAWEALYITKGFRNRKASALNRNWCKLKQEIATVKPLPEVVRVRVGGRGPGCYPNMTQDKSRFTFVSGRCSSNWKRGRCVGGKLGWIHRLPPAQTSYLHRQPHAQSTTDTNKENLSGHPDNASKKAKESLDKPPSILLRWMTCPLMTFRTYVRIETTSFTRAIQLWT